MFASIPEALDYMATQEIAMVDLKVAGVGGQWLHVTVPAKRFSQALFEEGVGFDGSSGAGFRGVEDGDVAAMPDPTTGFIDPFCADKTLSFICDAVTADTREPLPTDPRGIARTAVEYMRSKAIADEALMAPEFEFYIFDRVKIVTQRYRTVVEIESSETAADGGAPEATRNRGYLRSPPADHLHNIRSEIANVLEGLGIAVRYHHHEVGTCGQCEIEIDRSGLVTAADRAMLIKYVIRNTAARHGKIATFMPKPVHGEAGSGMHVHQKLDKEGRALFFDSNRENYAHLSDLALKYVGGLLKNGRALAAFTNPSTNSYKRLVPGFEAPVNLFFSVANRSAAIRIPRYATSPEEKRIEYRPPDFTCNVYLALAGMLMAGVDGIESGIDVNKHPFGPFEVDVTQQVATFPQRIVSLPTSLDEALAALSDNHTFLVRGNVFPESMILDWVRSRRTVDVTEVARRPHPFEYQLYMDV